MLEDQIRKDLKSAQKQKETLKVSVLRFLLSAIHNRQIEKQEKLTDEDVIGVIRTQVKQRKESIEAFKKGGRSELVQKEEEELKLLSKYLPQEISEEELLKIIDKIISDTGACHPSDFGKVMGQVMGQVKGRAEGRLVADLVKSRLAP